MKFSHRDLEVASLSPSIASNYIIASDQDIYSLLTSATKRSERYIPNRRILASDRATR